MQTPEFLMISNAICPNRDLIVFENKRFTFAQIDERVNRLANSLRDRGIGRGDRIGMLQVNCNQYVEIYFAAAKLGAIFVPLNFRAKAEELSYMIVNAEAKILFMGNRYMDIVRQMRAQLPCLKECITLDGGVEGWTDYQELMSGGSPAELITDMGDEDVTILLYTAGTTGRPKGVPLRHNNLVTYMLENVDPADPDISERNLLTVPLYHVAGIQAMLAAVYGGRTLLMMKQFETEEWLMTVQKEKATRAMLVPTMLKWVIDHSDFDSYDLSSLTVISYGAAPMPYEVISKAIEKFPGVRFINAFGQTETGSTVTSLGPEDHVIEGNEEERQKKRNRLKSSVGRPLSGVEIQIVDEKGRVLPSHEVGEIWARGPWIMKGYWGDTEKTEEVFTDEGWLRTGDRGWMDEDGYIFLAGRGDDMIIRGGENISPGEVENIIESHPKVDEAAVIGIPDPEWGQQVMAVVVLKGASECTNEEIIDYCRGKLAGFKRPESVIFVNELPRNSVGKILKKELRETYGRTI
jgi:acyl-CoA synthetase (AMP-forming)/AMP-acid ligase II